jgi:uroporphyrinogen decarboxylase
MKEEQRQFHRHDMADLYIATAERYEHSAIFVHPNPDTFDECARLIEFIGQKTGDRYFIMMHGNVTYGIPDGDTLMAFCLRLKHEPQQLKDEMEAAIDKKLKEAERMRQLAGLDGFVMCNDYCFNTGLFLSPRQFNEFITPCLSQLIQGYRELGYYVIKHTDGNIMPILDQRVETRPHALHSLDPQAGVDIAVVKRRFGDRLCLIGNVNCSLLDTGSEQEVIASTRYAFQHGMPGGGYIFSTGNCIYTGMSLEKYERMLDVWRREGNYPQGAGGTPSIYR